MKSQEIETEIKDLDERLNDAELKLVDAQEFSQVTADALEIIGEILERLKNLEEAFKFYKDHNLINIPDENKSSSSEIYN